MFFKFSVATLLIASLVHLGQAQVPFVGCCPEVKVVEDFQLDKYTGIWYEHSKYPFVFEIGKKCMFAIYEDIGNNTISVVNAAVSRLTGKASNVTGKAKAISAGQLAVVFPSSRNQNFEKPNYLVLGTDYTSYAVVYSCKTVTPLAHTKVIWILTRERKPADILIENAHKVLDNNQLSKSFLIETNQENCPEPNSHTVSSAEEVAEGVVNFTTDATLEAEEEEMGNLMNSI